MKKDQPTETNKYIHSMHKFGRRAAVLTIIVMLAMPTIAGIYFGEFPSLVQILTASAGLLAIFIPTNIGEVISYTPIVGSSIYLTFIIPAILPI
ncbi:hypothetical protein [Enterococcus olivae]